MCTSISDCIPHTDEFARKLLEEATSTLESRTYSNLGGSYPAEGADPPQGIDDVEDEMGVNAKVVEEMVDPPPSAPSHGVPTWMAK